MLQYFEIFPQKESLEAFSPDGHHIMAACVGLAEFFSREEGEESQHTITDPSVVAVQLLKGFSER